MDWFALVVSVIAAFLNARKQRWCWIFYLVSNVAWVWFAFTTKQNPLLATNIMFAGINVYGLIQWWKPVQPKPEPKKDST